MNNDNNKSFWYKYKNDSKYKAKVQLTLYVVFIVLVIIYINISSIGNNYDYGNNINNDISNINSTDKSSNLFDNISDNYNYSISVIVDKKSDNENNQQKKYNYTGKRYKDNTIINKNASGTSNTYYKIEDEYYIKENNEYKFIDNSSIYDLINKKYIELNDVKRFIKKANLDHVTNESTGNNNYKYNLLVRDIIRSYKGEDVVTIDINIKDNILHIDVDYSNLFKQIDDSILSCKISYKYTNIDKVEKFTIIEDN